MKKSSLVVGLAVAAMAFAGAANAQSNPQSAMLPAPPAPGASTAPTGPTTVAPASPGSNAFAQNGTTYIEASQPASVADLARASRARKATQAKSVKIFDDQNMPHAPIAEGQQAPGYSSGSSGGRVTLIDFWATWCGPCRHALPGLKQLQSIYGSDQIEVISVSEDEDEDQWRSFVANNGMNWTQKRDEGHQMMHDYGATALPTYVLIGKDGHVVKQWVGDAEDQTLVDRMGDDLKSSLSAKL
ncbi:MAG: thioredoxin-like domain-containing protein [Candidatus Acidiferrales bacterium]|jgi:thiol-disulfide isomerase/thioredoxin